MRFVRLGDTVLTRIGLGTNRLTNAPENQASVRAAIEVGVNFIDTAHLYTDGGSEQGDRRRSRTGITTELLLLRRGGLVSQL